MFRLKMCHLQAYAIFPLPDAFPTLRSNSVYKSGTHVIKPSKYFFIFYKKCFTVCVLILKCFNFVTERCVDNKRIFNSESRCRITADIGALLVFFSIWCVFIQYRCLDCCAVLSGKQFLPTVCGFQYLVIAIQYSKAKCSV